MVRGADGGHRFPHLFRPGRLGTMEIRNRLVMCPMADGLSNADGTVSAAQIDYYGARARGGAGLIIVGSCVVAYPCAAFAPNMTGISGTQFLSGLRALTREAHAGGARIAAQLVHDGVYALEDVAAGRPLLVPSPPAAVTPDRLALMASPVEIAARLAPFQAPGARLEYRDADEDDLGWVIARFADAAALALDAGFDGVELHAGHGYLIDSFLSPASNRRTDRWGGSLDNRARLLCEVIAAVRARVGRDFPVWCRLNAVERFVEGGETIADAIAVAHRAIGAGLDAIHVTANANAGVGIAPTSSHTPHAPGALVQYAAAIKRAVGVPIIAFGRLSPAAAEKVLADGDADFIAMGRKLLADAELPNKLARGAVEEIRPCIYHYRCIGNLYLRGQVSCVVNPALGRVGGDAPMTSRAQRVLVVGGGPAGLEAARRLALAGARVTLVERAATLGGQLTLAARADADLVPLLEWLVLEMERLAVEVVLGQDADANFVASHAPDAVVVAMGGVWRRPTAAGAGLPIVCTPDDPRWTVPSAREDRVVVLGGGKAGLSIAAAVARRGGLATVLESGELFAPELGPPGRAQWVHDLEHAGVRLVSAALVRGISSRGVTWAAANEAEQFTPADLVVAATGVTPSAMPWGGRASPRVIAIGECAGEHHLEGVLRGAMRAAELLCAPA